MANLRITDLPSTTAAAGDQIPINRSGTDRKITLPIPVVLDTSPTLGGQFNSNNHTMLVPRSNNSDHRSAGLDGASKGGSCFAFKTTDGAKVMEFRSGDYKLSASAGGGLDADGAYIYVANSPVHSECIIGVDADQANTHHTRLGFSSYAGDPMSFHFDLDGPQTDFPSIDIFANTDKAQTRSYAPLMNFISYRTTGGSAPLGTIGALAANTTNDLCGAIFGQAYVSTAALSDISAIFFKYLNGAAGAEFGVVGIQAQDGTGSNPTQVLVGNGMLVGNPNTGPFGPTTGYTLPGNGNIGFYNSTAAICDKSGNEIIRFLPAGSTNAVNEFTVINSSAGVAPEISATGGDTDIDIRLTPKGTGVLRFGTFASTAAEVITGYITIKDAAGNSRKLAVIA